MATRRNRPKLATTIAPDVDAALRAKAKAHDLPIGRVTDALLRSMLGIGIARAEDESIESFRERVNLELSKT